MPAHRLKEPPPGSGQAATAVARILTGSPVDEAAAGAQLDPAHLVRLVDVFAEAGYRAVDEHATDGPWWQANVHFDAGDRNAARSLAEALGTARSEGYLSRWWFMRKSPGWRLRLDLTGPRARVRTGHVLDTLTAQGTVHRWWPELYEPETAAFGGRSGMDTAHELFCADSGAIAHLAPEADLPLGHRQTSLMLCTELMHAAGLDTFERGDVWDLVCAMRPLPHSLDRTRVEAMLAPVRILAGADTGPDGAMFGPAGPLHTHAAWAEAFSEAGVRLGRARSRGVLHRGLRRVVAHCVLFHWNRLAVPAGVQAALARAARTVLLGVPVQAETQRRSNGPGPDRGDNNREELPEQQRADSARGPQFQDP